MMMETKEMQNQIDEINRKLDLVLEHIHEQNSRTMVVEDLMSDLTIISNDAYRSTVAELDRKGVELDTEQLKVLLFKFMNNIPNIVHVMNMLESIMDLMKDAGSIVSQMGIDAINKLHEFEQKGYFEYFAEFGKLLRKISEHYTAKDLSNLSENIGPLVNSIKNLTQPEFLHSMEKITKALSEVKPDDKLDNKSLLKLFKELRSPEVRKSLSYSLRLVKTINS